MESISSKRYYIGCFLSFVLGVGVTLSCIYGWKERIIISIVMLLVVLPVLVWMLKGKKQDKAV